MEYKYKSAEENSLPRDSSFSLTARELADLMNYRGQEAITVIDDKYGGVFGVCKKLNTSPNQGLSGSKEDSKQRRQIYGTNEIPVIPPRTFMEFLQDALKNLDRLQILLVIAPLVSLILSVILPAENAVSHNYESLESVAIIAVVLVTAVLFPVYNEYNKEKKLRESHSDMVVQFKIPTIRNAELFQSPVSDLLVGDICQIKKGDQVPADGLVIQSSNLKVDESSLTGETDHVSKSVTTDPILLSGTVVVEGCANMLVIVVGRNTQVGTILGLLTAVTEHDRSKEDVPVHHDSNGSPFGASDTCRNTSPEVSQQNATNEASPLKEKDQGNDRDEESESEFSIFKAKLTKLVIHAGKIASIVALLTVVILISQFSISLYSHEQGFRWSDLERIVSFFTIGITLLAVIVPGGLLFSITSSQAFSISVYWLLLILSFRDACWAMGNITAVCICGSLTKNQLEVVQGHFAGAYFKQTSRASEMPAKAVQLIAEGLATNSAYASRITPTQGGFCTYVGNKTECALLAFINLVGLNYQSIRDLHPEEEFHKVYPFNSARKSMSTVIRLKDGSGFRVHTKGASEGVMRSCNFILGPNSEILSFPESDRKKTTMEVIAPMELDGLRTIGSAYKDILFKGRGSPGPNDQVIGTEPDWENEEEFCLSNMTMLAIFGVENPVREDALAAVERFQKEGMTVRLVTGEDIRTASSVALKCGIIRPNDGMLVLEGDEFMKLVRDKETIHQTLIDKVWPKLRVLARAKPQDKYLLVKGIEESKIGSGREVVAVVGERTSDAPALMRANVGFTMGVAGNDVAKEAADIILTDDSFTGIMKSYIWGRNIYDNVAKFLQFQLTTNVVTVVVAVIGTCVIGITPLRAVQMLWVNVIVDILASRALSTDHPATDILSRKPDLQIKPLISRTMMKNILGQCLYQLTVIFVLLLRGPALFGFEDGGNAGTRPTVHLTLIFNALVMMTLFNEINARKIHGERNVFAGVLRNRNFVLTWVAMFISQILLVQFGSFAFSTTKITLELWIYSLLLGVGALVWQQIIVTMPTRKIPKSFCMRYITHSDTLPDVPDNESGHDEHRE